MSREQELLETISALYRAAQDPTSWPTVLGRITSLVKAHSGVLFINEHRTDRPLMGLTIGLDPTSWEEYEEEYHRHDIWRHAILRHPRGSVVSSTELVPVSSLASSIWLNEFLYRYDIFHALASLLDGPESQFLSCFRSDRAEEFDSQDKKILETLAPHVSAALEVHFLVGTLQARTIAVDAALDQFSLGIVLVDSCQRVAEMNRSAREILTAEDGLTIRNGRLTAQQRSKTAALEALLARAIEVGKGREMRALEPMSLERPSNERPYSIQVAPCPTPETKSPFLNGRSVPAAFVFITDPSREVELPEDGLKRIYGLTQAEARLASRLANGHTLKEISAELDIAVGTARNQLKSILHKTDTRRQAELVRLLLSDTLLTNGTSSQRKSSD